MPTVEPTSSPPTPITTEAGWHTDPDGTPKRQRWFDGETWTDRTRIRGKTFAEFRTEKEAEKAAKHPGRVKAPARDKRNTFEGIVIDPTAGTITHRDGSGLIGGARASVETAGEIDRRLSATRVIMTGGVGLFWRKKVDKRELYVSVEGPGYSFVEQIDPDKGMKAREFTARINTFSSQIRQPAPTLTASPLPSLPVSDPAGTPSLADELKKLAELRDAGVLSPGEFDAQKAKLLS